MEPLTPVVPPHSPPRLLEPPDDPGSIDWANHFWDEYKYRHEAWWRTFYRSIWIMGFWGVVPWIQWVRDQFPHAVGNSVMRGVYGVLLLGFFVLVVRFLAGEFDNVRAAEHQVEIFRGSKTPERPEQFAVFTDSKKPGRESAKRLAAFNEKGVSWKSGWFIFFMVVVWVIWFYYLLYEYTDGGGSAVIL